MRRGKKQALYILSVLLVFYILLAFLIPFVKTAVFWFSFVFTLIAFGVAAYALYTAFLKKPDARSRFYGFPIARIGVLYCGIQLAVGLLFMALGKWIPAWLAVLVYAAMLGQHRRGGGDHPHPGREAQEGCSLYARPPIQGEPDGRPVQSTGSAAVLREYPLQRPRQQRSLGRDRAGPVRGGG